MISMGIEMLIVDWLKGISSLSDQPIRTQAETLTTLADSMEHDILGSMSTVRGLYYSHSALFRESQSNAIKAIESACKCLQPYLTTIQSSSSLLLSNALHSNCSVVAVSREHLHFRASPKGYVVGQLSFQVSSDSSSSSDVPGYLLDVSSHGPNGALLPTGDVHMSHFSSTATWILVVEKEATAATIASSLEFSSLNCILVCGKGYPCLTTRRFTSQLASSLPHLPIAFLVDCNPHGLQIMLTYCFGNIERGKKKNNNPSGSMSLPANRVHFLGLWPSEAVHSPCRQPWTSHDDSIAASVTNRLQAQLQIAPENTHCVSQLLEELTFMQKQRVKAELQSLEAKQPQGTVKYVQRKGRQLGLFV